MTNLDTRPTESLAVPSGACAPRFELHEARTVPLGGIRAMEVRRTLPQRALPTVGAWCFLDQFGPASAEPMRVLPHPHTGLQTVTWPVVGQIRHRDSLGSDVLVRPGELNLMTAGRGVSHSEFSVLGAELAGVQLWAALPTGAADGAPSFEQVRDLPVHAAPGLRVTVLVGSVGDAVSPARVHTPLLGADARVDAGALARVPLRADFEHAVLVLAGTLEVDGHVLSAGPLAYLGGGRAELTVRATGGDSRFLLLGGTPFTEDLVMFWNFVGRTHEDVVTARADWAADATAAVPDRRFGTVHGHGGERIPAPEVPTVRLQPRRRGGPAGAARADR